MNEPSHTNEKAQPLGLRLLLANRSRSLPLRRALITALRTGAIGRRTVAVAMWADAFGTTFGPTILAAYAGFRTARTRRARRTHFVHRDFPVAIFIELAQSFRGVLDFVIVDHAIVIRIKGGHEWRNHRALPCPTGTARAIFARPIRVCRFTRTWIARGGTFAALRAQLV